MGMNCMKLKVRRQLQVQLKEIRMIGNKVKFILDDALFDHCLSSSLVVLANRVDIFRRMNLASQTTLEVVTTTI
jgi:hypothetical protein